MLKNVFHLVIGEETEVTAVGSQVAVLNVALVTGAPVFNVNVTSSGPQGDPGPVGSDAELVWETTQW